MESREQEKQYESSQEDHNEHEESDGLEKQISSQIENKIQMSQDLDEIEEKQDHTPKKIKLVEFMSDDEENDLEKLMVMD